MTQSPGRQVLLVHHVQGLTDGVVAFADELRAAGHLVHTPDLFDGRTFPTIAAGQEHLERVGFEETVARGVAAARDLPSDMVYAGFSLGVAVSQRLAQTRPGALGGLFYHAFLDPAWVGPWPPDLPVQVHGMAADPFFAGEGDLAAARAVAAEHPPVEVFVYPGTGHLFTDRSCAEHDPAAARLVLSRTLAFLERLDRRG